MIYDLVVVGCGGIGSAVLYHAAKQGALVLGIDQHDPPHDRGSSHGKTRIIRQAYFEHPDYVPLLLEAYRLWAELEAELGCRLYQETGLLQAGPIDGVVVPGVLRSALQHQLDVEHWSSSEAMTRFPAFRIPSHHDVAFERKAGYLRVEACVQSHLEAASRSGAKILRNVAVDGWKGSERGIVLQTRQGPVQAQHVLLTVGAWLPKWFRSPQIPLRVLRKHLYWFRSSDPRTSQSSGCPLFLFENQEGCFYGFSSVDDQGIKVGEHSGGEEIKEPNELDRSLDGDDLARVQAFLSSYFYGELSRVDHAVCMYTMTPDSHFIIDHHPEDPRISIAGGFSGHGFKFASVLGKWISHLCLTGERDSRLHFLRIQR